MFQRLPLHIGIFLWVIFSASQLVAAEKNDASTVSYAQLEHDNIEPVAIKQTALLHANNNDAEKAVASIEQYLLNTGDTSILNDHLFYNIQFSDAYQSLKERFEVRFTPLSLVFFYVGFLGFYIFLILVLRKAEDKISNLLIGLFVLFHSLFILHLSLYVVNAQLHFPNALFVSTTFSFLYGPLLYFYFKRVTYKHQFVWRDLVHCIPSAVLLVYIIPFYGMSYLEKFEILLLQESFLLPGANIIIIGKILSLTLYSALIVRLYQKSKIFKSKPSTNVALWQRNLVAMFVIYSVSYVFYAGVITNLIQLSWMLNLQIVIMVSLVFYVAYIAYARPEIFKGNIKLVDPVSLYKYKKSGLTPGFSSDLKEKLVLLLNDDKVYRQSNISLNILAEMLDTTRHNTSQVINEHFQLNFYELINKYRIEEAIEILENDTQGNLNIIDVAYEVGFNNKVTFNKSFKKYYHQTPSQYLLSTQR